MVVSLRVLGGSTLIPLNHVSHQYSDFGSILRFVETMFRLPQVNAKVGYADTYALGDLSDFYDLSQTPLTFTPIASDKDAKFFINKQERAPAP